MAVWTVYLSLCLLMALSASVEARPVRSTDCGVCSFGWSAYGCRCFKFIDYALMWIDAEKICLSVAGNLASVHSLGEFYFIQNLVRSATSTDGDFWIGGSDAVHEGYWLWSDGSEMNYEIWASGEPSNYNGQEHCLEMSYYGNWNDAECSVMLPFVCVK